MTKKKSDICGMVCWALAALAGVLVYLTTHSATSVVAALLLGFAVAAFLGVVFSLLVCGRVGIPAPAQPEGELGMRTAGSNSGSSNAGEIAARAAAMSPKANPPTPTPPEPAGPRSKGLLGMGDANAKAPEPEAAKPKAAAKPKTAAEPAPAPAASATPDYDKDGVLEGENEGSRPEALSGPRGGKADDLKQIKGIGPALEKLCNSLGFYHFDQIAGWSADEVAWVDANLKGFKGRVSRDTWVEQAKVLAAGGETEFSKRVEDGDVY